MDNISLGRDLDRWGMRSMPCPLAVLGGEESKSSKASCFSCTHTPHQNELCSRKHRLVRAVLSVLAQMDQRGEKIEGKAPFSSSGGEHSSGGMGHKPNQTNKKAC